MTDFPDSTDVDPFTLGYRGIVAALQASPLFMGLVRPGNLRDETATGARGKPVLQSADLPQVELMQTSFGLNPQAINSLTAGWQQDYPLVVVGPIGGPVAVNKIKWAVFCALSHAGDDLGLRFVRGWSVINATDRTPTPEASLDGTAKQYASVLVVRLECYWPKKLLPF